MTPCNTCLEQLSKERYANPHEHLALLSSIDGSHKFGGWEIYSYVCQICGAKIDHINDKNDFAPWWRLKGEI